MTDSPSEPSQLYNRNKRNLALFVGLLALVMAGGIKTKDGSSTTLLPFQISNPDLLQHVLFLIAIYSLFQYWFSWTFQRDEIRVNIKYDFYIIIFISTVILLIYLYKNWFDFLINYWAERKVLVVAIFGVVAGALTALALQSAELVKWRRESLFLRRETIEQRLLKPGWVLNFNPRQMDGTKSITFEDDGAIGEGRNNNEHTWKISDGHLGSRLITSSTL